jgi:CPA1 family monovalent cation:H+ antiporter
MDTLMVFMAMLLVAMLAEPVARRMHLPFSVLLVFIGFVGSEVIVWMGMDTGLRWQQFNHLILHVFVPVLVFESAFNMRARVLLVNLPLVLVLAIPAMLLAAAITGVILYLGIGHPSGFPLIAALLCGTIVSATDPVAVVALFKQLGAPERLTALLEGESLFNDATAVVVFTLLVALAVTPGENMGAGAATLAFLHTFGGGVLAGLAVGALASLLYRWFREPVSHAVTSLVTAYSAFTSPNTPCTCPASLRYCARACCSVRATAAPAPGRIT